MNANKPAKEKVFAMDEMHMGKQFKYQDSVRHKERKIAYHEWAAANADRHTDHEDQADD
jgi:hypothetical protein